MFQVVAGDLLFTINFNVEAKVIESVMNKEFLSIHERNLTPL